RAAQRDERLTFAGDARRVQPDESKGSVRVWRSQLPAEALLVCKRALEQREPFDASSVSLDVRGHDVDSLETERFARRLGSGSLHLIGQPCARRSIRFRAGTMNTLAVVFGNH